MGLELITLGPQNHTSLEKGSLRFFNIYIYIFFQFKIS